jgi:PPK2 family polyphosphate:nucleotide phosphotransferase
MAATDRDRWVVKPGAPVDLGKIDPAATPGAPGDKAVTTDRFAALHERLASLQERLWAEHRRAVLLVLQAIDAGGKDGTVKHVFAGVNPQGVRVTSFKVPTDEERTHDFLWRVHAHAPASGEIAVFNRSHYEDVLVPRVHGLVPAAVWKHRYEHIRAFEALLAGRDTTIVKLHLHVSHAEQRARLEARIQDPTKHWKFNPADLEESERYDDYRRAYEDLLRETSTAEAPWYVVPADRKWYRNWAVSRILIETLEDLDPQYPKDLLR